MKHPKPKRLFLDIETSPNVVLSWRVGRNISLDFDNILGERRIICMAWKWEHQKIVRALQWNDDQDDADMLRNIVPVLDAADEIIAHNGDRFDLRWIRTRCMKHRIPCQDRYKTFDTLKVARAQFYLNSNRLDYISRFLGDDGKMDTGGFRLWKAVCVDNNRPALGKMIRYCKNDVRVLETVYHEILPYAQPITHVGVFTGGDKWQCPECGSESVTGNGSRATRMGYIRHKMRCSECRRAYVISQKSFGDYLEAKVDERARRRTKESL